MLLSGTAQKIGQLFVGLIYLSALTYCVHTLTAEDLKAAKYLPLIVSFILSFWLYPFAFYNNNRRKQKGEKEKISHGTIPSPSLELPIGHPIQQFSSRIKEVWVELYDYSFYHSPFSKDVEAKHSFLGRKTAKERIITLLRESVTSSGAYLVTGFRGMGKTSLVRLAIGDYNRSISLESKKNNWSAKGQKTVKVIGYLGALLTCTWLVFLPIFPDYFSEQQFTDHGILTLKLIFGHLLMFFVGLGAAPISTKGVGTLLSLGLVVSAIFLLVPRAVNGSVSLTKESIEFLAILQFTLGFYFLILITRFLFDLFCLIKYHIRTSAPQRRVYRSFEINLSQDEIGEQSILKRLTQELSRYWREELREENYHAFISPVYLPIHWLIKFFGYKPSRISYRTIRNRLSLLEQRLSAEITAHENATINPSFATRTGLGMAKVVLPSFDYSKRNQATFPIASAKEIEDNLIHIFKDIEAFRKQNTSIPRFLFIIDELDKIEPNSSTTITDRESSDPYFDRDTSIRGGNRVRERQEALASLLANLKGFLNVVRAKFIFIGGREMYDASLADIADRDSFYSSIFNDVIYVSSFFKDKNEARAGVTQMTVAYLTQLFFPSQINRDSSLNLRTFSEQIQPFSQEGGYRFSLHYGGNLSRADKKLPIDSTMALKQLVPFFGSPTTNSLSFDEQLFQLAKAKVIATLQNYAIYLTYRSNGTPKKLIALIERNIRHAPSGDSNADLLVVSQNMIPQHSIDRRMFLRLKFDFQYEIGLTANLYRPFIITNSRYLKALGDKLLFSSAFILDHILKFHPFGFSWRNLELIPEVILINKEPNLRQFIESLIRFLSKQYIRPTVSGIFQYKFFSKTAIELGLVSRISDLGAAAFNFTLDESLQIKRYYKRKLSEIQEKYRKTERLENQFINSISFIQTILGDLHYYDKEYDDALIYYTESIQHLRVNNKKDKITKHQFILWLRNKLKAGLTLEKMRAFDSVFSYYRTLIIEMPNFVESILDIEGKKTAYRSLQLLAKPAVAWLATIEKQRFDGITSDNLKERHRDIYRLLFPKDKYGSLLQFDPQRQSFLHGDYLNNVGSILFYKNKYFHELNTDREFIENVPNNMRKELVENTPQHQIDKAFFTSSQAAYLYYLNALKKLLYQPKGIASPNNNLDLLGQAALLLSSKFAHVFSAEKSYYLANVIAKIGDTILATSYKSQAGAQQFEILEYSEFIDTPFANVFLNKLQKDLTKSDSFTSDLAMRVYLLAYAYFKKAGRMHSAAFQLKKLLFCLRDIGSTLKARTFRNEREVKQLMDYTERIALEIFRLHSGTGEVANRPQFLKYEEILRSTAAAAAADDDADDDDDDDEENISHRRKIIYNLLTTSSDTREVIVTVEEIRLRLYKRGKDMFTKELPEELFNMLTLSNQFISPYSTANSRFLRLLELKFRCEVLYCYLKDVLRIPYLFESAEAKRNGKSLNTRLGTRLKQKTLKKRIGLIIPAELQERLTYEELFIFIITEGIFCTREIIRTINLFSPGYIISYSFLADNHRRMSYWCQAKENLEAILDQEGKNLLNDKLKYIIGNNAISSLEPNYQRELALHNFSKTIEMHTEGRLYKGYILNTYILEDDLNDNFAHFCAALERFRLNNGSISRKIEKLQTDLADSKLYKYESYFPLSRG